MIPPYDHVSVNHQLQFVNATDDTTNHIEAMWARCKKKFKQMHGTSEEMVLAYLEEFMSRQRFGKTPDECFDNLLTHISDFLLLLEQRTVLIFATKYF